MMLCSMRFSLHRLPGLYFHFSRRKTVNVNIYLCRFAPRGQKVSRGVEAMGGWAMSLIVLS